MIVTRRVRVPRAGIKLVVALGAAAALLTACSSSGSDSAPAAPELGHIHNLSLVGDTLFMGTHEGLWQEKPAQVPVLVSQEPFDVMGLTRAGDRWLASGHPTDVDAPGNLGLVESTDDGVTWQPVSLSGEVDFHRLVAAGDVVMGVWGHGGKLLRSEDGGASWVDLGSPLLYDLAVDPTDPEVVVGTTEGGPVRSTDGGRTFTPINSSVLLALLAWTGNGLYATSVDGQILQSTDSGATWNTRGTLGGQVEALAADANTLVGLVGNTIFESTDGGVSFSPRLIVAG